MTGAASILRVAAGQPAVVGDLDATVAAHAAMIRAAASDLIVFPELSLTGYRFDAALVDVLRDRAVLRPLIDACADVHGIALVGAPVDGPSIATVQVDADGLRIAYRKVNLSAGEAQHFQRGAGPAVIDVHGWRVGLAICRDTGIEQHTRELTALGIDVYACGVVHHRNELDEQERRAQHIATSAKVPVVLASFAGPTGEGYADTAGQSSIWAEDGSVIGRAGEEPGEFTTAILRRQVPGDRRTRRPRSLH